jgi:hypothetical protein
MNTKVDLPNPQHVLDLRIHLARNWTITPEELLKVAGGALVTYMTDEGMPDPELTEEDGLHWRNRDLRDWMKKHPVLAELYAEGKRIRNPSGLCHEDYERNRLRKLGKLV